MKTETFDNAADFLAAVNGKKRTKRGRTTRPDLPSAGRSAPTGLTTLIAPQSGKPAWSVWFDVVKGHRLYVIGRVDLDTGWCASEAAACAAAKLLIHT